MSHNISEFSKKRLQSFWRTEKYKTYNRSYNDKVFTDYACKSGVITDCDAHITVKYQMY